MKKNLLFFIIFLLSVTLNAESVYKSVFFFGIGIEPQEYSVRDNLNWFYDGFKYYFLFF